MSMRDPHAFEALRGHLTEVAYSMLGSVADAEDLVQEAWLRWSRSETQVEDPRAFLVTTISRLALDELRSARVRRTSYVGPWLPEPWITAEGDPERDVSRAQHMEFAWLVLLEELAPLERAVFVLREVFDYDYAAIGALVERSDVACRQLARRARERVGARRGRFTADPTRHAELVAAFVGAVSMGDADALSRVLAQDAIYVGDGGGVVSNALKPVLGNTRVVRLMLGLAKQRRDSIVALPLTLNGLPALVLAQDGAVDSVLLFEVDGDAITKVFSVRNPSKISHLQSVVDAWLAPSGA